MEYISFAVFAKLMEPRIIEGDVGGNQERARFLLEEFCEKVDKKKTEDYLPLREGEEVLAVTESGCTFCRYKLCFICGTPENKWGPVFVEGRKVYYIGPNNKRVEATKEELEIS